MNCFGVYVTYCTTLETDRDTRDVSYAPSPLRRAKAMENFADYGHRTMVTVEPIMDFGLDEFVYMIVQCHPCQVNIGADSGHNHLPEPGADKVRELIAALEAHGIKVVQKKNLKRILEHGC